MIALKIGQRFLSTQGTTEPLAPPMIGQVISHYRIIGEIGRGAMGVVYLAEHTVLGRRVAIKTAGLGVVQ